MSTLTAIVEKNHTGYSAYLKEVDGIVAFGQNMSEIRKNMMAAINANVCASKDLDLEMPAALRGDYTVQYDTTRVKEWH